MRALDQALEGRRRTVCLLPETSRTYTKATEAMREQEGAVAPVLRGHLIRALGVWRSGLQSGLPGRCPELLGRRSTKRGDWQPRVRSAFAWHLCVVM